MAAERIPIDKYDEAFGPTNIDLISAPLGGKIIAFSDEFFAAADNLIQPHAPIRRAGYYVETGAWFDGWETRRHNPNPTDWVIIRLGVSSGLVTGTEIDTAYFSGNQAPAVSIEGCSLPPGTDPVPGDSTVWIPILDEIECEPSTRHLWKLVDPPSEAFTHVRLHQHPDGGIARFRLYGSPIPVFPDDLASIIDLAHVSYGGLAVACSDQHFGRKENLLLPGRGKDMGDGWETKRSRGGDHIDWVIVKLGAKTEIDSIEIDTAHFRGNFPQAASMLACSSSQVIPSEDTEWIEVLGKQKLSADKQHVFGAELTKVNGVRYTHVKMVIMPDGGVKRLRLYGRRYME